MPFLSLMPLTVDLQTHLSKGPTHLPCVFGVNLFSSSGDISHRNKKNTDSAKNSTFRSSLCVAMNALFCCVC